MIIPAAFIASYNNILARSSTAMNAQVPYAMNAQAPYAMNAQAPYVMNAQAPYAVNAQAPQNGFGMTNYEIKCVKFVYSKSTIYDTAENFCNHNASQPGLRYRNHLVAGYRTNYPTGTTGDDKKLLNPELDIIPIIEHLVYPFQMERHLRLKKNKYNEDITWLPGDDRLVLGPSCTVLGILTDLDFPQHADSPRIKWCTVLEKPSDEEIPSPKSSRPSFRSSERYH